MLIPEPETILVEENERGLDQAIQGVGSSPAVFLIWPREGAPYLARTNALRRRLKRLMRQREGSTRFLNLRAVAARIEYWDVGSRLEAFLISLELGRLHFPDSYRQRFKLRLPPYVKLLLSNTFPRTVVSTRLTASRARFFGPFRTRTAAERFESEFLDLFQIRRCHEDIEPSPDHPGCIYGEMNRCLRPCQEVVGIREYESEVERVSEFLATGGESMLRSVAAARERFSDDLDFEEAARQHQQYERIRQVQRLRDDLVRDIDCLNGVAVTPSPAPQAVELWFCLRGVWQAPRRFSLASTADRPVSLDSRLREIVAGMSPARATVAERQEHLAVLARWYYSSWRDGEWLPFEALSGIPYRRLVNAIHRVATAC